MVGNTATSPEDLGVATVGKNHGWGIPSFKPQAQDRLIKLFQMAEKLDVIAIEVDLEGAGLRLGPLRKKWFTGRVRPSCKNSSTAPENPLFQGKYEH